MLLKKTIARNFINMRGIRTPRKLVIIESDDWGSIRMPSREVFQSLKAEGFHPETDPYLKYDALESDEDLHHLYTVLNSVQDSKGNPAVLTANAVVANPDFDRISADQFRAYHYEPFTTTLTRYSGREQVLELWKQGIKNGIFIPQFHGREHLHVKRWMADLSAGDELLHKAFAHRMISISSVPSGMRYAYMEGMDHQDETERLAKKEVLETGHSLFQRLTGYGSRTFIANCYIWDDTVEQVLQGEGIVVMQGILNQIKPVGEGKHVVTKHYMGEKKNGMAYTIRNVFFEPSLDPAVSWIDEAMSRIQTAFRWQKPAIIGSHRLNYIGSIDPGNREKNLALLKDLLHQIVRQWPDVEFISSASLAELIVNESFFKPQA